MHQVVRAATLAAVLLTGFSATQAALVKFRLTGVATQQSAAFDDGTVVPEGARVVLTYTYETRQAATNMLLREDGIAGQSSYDITAPYRFKMTVGGHRIVANGYRVDLSNNLNEAFGDTYDVDAASGLTIDGAWMPNARMKVSLMSRPGREDALTSLRMPKRLKEYAFDAFRVGHLWRDQDHALVSFLITNVKSSVCASEAVPGTDECADTE